MPITWRGRRVSEAAVVSVVYDGPPSRRLTYCDLLAWDAECQCSRVVPTRVSDVGECDVSSEGSLEFRDYELWEAVFLLHCRRVGSLLAGSSTIAVGRLCRVRDLGLCRITHPFTYVWSGGSSRICRVQVLFADGVGPPPSERREDVAVSRLTVLPEVDLSEVPHGPGIAPFAALACCKEWPHGLLEEPPLGDDLSPAHRELSLRAPLLLPYADVLEERGDPEAGRLRAFVAKVTQRIVVT